MERQGTTSWKDELDGLLREGYSLWEETALPPVPEKERYAAGQALAEVFAGEKFLPLAAACQSFYWFRRLHAGPEGTTPAGILLGDYFFSRFSQCMIPLDSPRLVDAFAAFLTRDAQTGREDYLAFVRGLPAVVAPC